MAVAHALLVMAYHMLKRKEDYREGWCRPLCPDRREPNPPLLGQAARTSGPPSNLRTTRPDCLRAVFVGGVARRGVMAFR